jgi:hypothetical protein
MTTLKNRVAELEGAVNQIHDSVATISDDTLGHGALKQNPDLQSNIEGTLQQVLSLSSIGRDASWRNSEDLVDITKPDKGKITLTLGQTQEAIRSRVQAQTLRSPMSAKRSDPFNSLPIVFDDQNKIWMDHCECRDLLDDERRFLVETSLCCCLLSCLICYPIQPTDQYLL